MKRLLIRLTCILALALPALTPARAQVSLDMLYSDFSTCRNAEGVRLGKLAFSLIRCCASLDKESREDTRILRMIDGIQVLDLSDCNASDRNRFTSRAGDVSLKNYDLLMEMGDDNEAMRIFVRQDRDHIKDFVLLSYGDSPAIIRIKGKIPIKDVSSLMESSVVKVR